MKFLLTPFMILILHVCIKEYQRRMNYIIAETYLWILMIYMVRSHISFYGYSCSKFVSDLLQNSNHNSKKKNVYRHFIIRPVNFGRYYLRLLNNPHMTEEEKMYHEVNRLASFSRASSDIPVSFIKLSKEGFYYEEERQTCKCAFCGVEYRDWQSTDDPTDIHRRESPNCPFLIDRSFISILTSSIGLPQTLFSLRNQGFPAIAHHGYTSSHQHTSSPLPQSTRYQQYSTIDGRNESFRGWPHERSSSIFAEAGFFYTGNGDTLKCAFCGIQLCNWKERDNPWFEHAHISPTCPHVIAVQGETFVQLIQKINLRTTLEEPSQITTNNGNQAVPEVSPAVHIKYSTKEKRIATFINWPGKQSRYEMSKAGFFYTGQLDRVVCFSCGVRLQKWEDDDEPFKEHAKWSHTCSFLKRMKGQRYIDDVQQSLQQNNPNLAHQQLLNENPAVKAVLEMGYAIQDVKIALERLGNVDMADITAKLILNKILDHEEAPLRNGKSLLQGKNKQDISSMFKCKGCMKNEVSIIFLPCGHLSCALCGPVMTQCHVCHVYIRQKMEVRF